MLKIVLVGDISQKDEAMKKVAYHMYENLSKSNNVRLLDIKQLYSIRFLSFLRELRLMNPDIIHYIPGPSIFSFLVLKIMEKCCPRSRTVISAMHPSFSSFSHGPYYGLSFLLQKLLVLLKPDLVLIQSFRSETFFKKLGCKTAFLPCGVDPTLFSPIDQNQKKRLRIRYKIKPDKFLILHVGSIRRSRNLQVLASLQNEENQVLVIGSTATPSEVSVYRLLTAKGVIVLRNYFEKIHEIYGLADCYIFPVVDEAGSVEMPLTVLEAMACNLPVISLKFAALPRIFTAGNGLFFVDDESEFNDIVDIVKKNKEQVDTRSEVLLLSWNRVVNRLAEIYQKLIAEN